MELAFLDPAAFAQYRAALASEPSAVGLQASRRTYMLAHASTALRTGSSGVLEGKQVTTVPLYPHHILAAH